MPSPALNLIRPKARFGVADAVLAALVIAVVGLMVVPLPTWLLDLLIASNLAASVVILLVSMYVSEALKIASFPTLLSAFASGAHSTPTTASLALPLSKSAGRIGCVCRTAIAHSMTRIVCSPQLPIYDRAI